MRISATIIIAWGLATYAKNLAAPTLVEVWCVGDDVLTSRFRNTLEDTFNSSPDFSLSSGKKPRTLIVTIPTNVHWKQIGRRTKVFYTVEFTSSENQRIVTRNGTCWDDTLMKCAARIVKEAKTAATKLQQRTVAAP